MTITLQPMAEADWPAIRAIYGEGLASGLAAFMLEPPQDWAEWEDGHLPLGRLVAREDSVEGRITGWAALSPVPDT